MTKGAVKYALAVLLAGIALPACNVTRKLQSDEYLLQKVVIKDDRSTPRKERIDADELKKYVRQMPNKHFLGTDFYVWVYNLANPEKDNGWNNFKRKIGEEPVLLDLDLTRKSAENLQIYMNSRGFFSSSVRCEVDTTYRKKRAKVTYSTKQNRPSRINRISYDFRDKFVEPIVCADTVNSLLHTGDIFDITVLDKERERITSYLRERGYYNFSVNNIEYIADTLAGDYTVDLRMVVKRNVTGYDERGDAISENNVVYRIREINILPDYDPAAAKTNPEYNSLFDTVNIKGLNVVYNKTLRPNVRPRVLRSTIPLYPNYLYDVQTVRRTYDDLMALGYFKSAKIVFDELPNTDRYNNRITYIGDIDGHRHMDSMTTNYTQEGYLKCDILCTPALKQNFNIELEASTTSSFYGVSATVGYQNLNLFRGIEQFDISVTAGYEYMKAPDAKRRNAMELGFAAGLWFPRFVPFRVSSLSSINRPRTKLEVAYNYQNRPYYRRNLSSLSWTYSWKNKRHTSWTLRPIDINLVDVGFLDETYANSLQNEYLKNSYRSQLICGLSASYYYNSGLRSNHTGNNYTIVRVNAESAGNLVDGLEHLFSHPASGSDYYEIFGIRYSQYVRFDASVSRTLQFGQVTALAGRLFAGYGLPYGNSDAMPFDRLFYAGGSNSMRGWAPRTLGPGSTPEPTGVIYPSQLANMKLEANLEFRFPIWGIFHGATFLDAGNIWYTGTSSADTPPDSEFHFNSFYKQIAFNTGVGLRIDIKFAILRLDWGIQLHNPNKPEGQRWIHNFKWANTALNFGVGYPF
ncbi:MAG: BamA/TamA family outer membrane protein [Alistipes sp.]|nr:BamA/TamA family outer membrane protein [Alistipes sp.]